MGGLNGGKTLAYLKLFKDCSQQIHTDLDHNIVAIYHDESHLNSYLRSHKCMIYSPAYGYPEGKQLPFEPKIIIRDKVKIDSFFDKSKGHSLLAKFKKALHILLHAIKWYI